MLNSGGADRNRTLSVFVRATVDAALLMLTTGIAFAFIRQGKVQQHRQWMTRSFAVALVFLEVRIILGVTGWENLGIAASESVVWTCVGFSVVVGHITLRTPAHAPGSGVGACHRSLKADTARISIRCSFSFWVRVEHDLHVLVVFQERLTGHWALRP